MRGDLVISPHCIRNPGTRAEAGKCRTDERQEHCERLNQHEGATCRWASKHPGPNQYHHVTERCAGGGGVGHRVTLIEKVIRGEIFNQVTEYALNPQG